MERCRQIFGSGSFILSALKADSVSMCWNTIKIYKSLHLNQSLGKSPWDLNCHWYVRSISQIKLPANPTIMYTSSIPPPTQGLKSQLTFYPFRTLILHSPWWNNLAHFWTFENPTHIPQAWLFILFSRHNMNKLCLKLDYYCWHKTKETWP